MIPSGIPQPDGAFLYNTAKAHTSSPQRPKYLEDLSTYLGLNPILILQNGSTIIYQVQLTGSLAVADDVITLPSTFTNAPTVNVAGSIVTNLTRCIIRNSDPTKAFQLIQFNVSVGGSTTTASITEALDGVKTLRTSNLRILPPTDLSATPPPPPPPAAPPPSAPPPAPITPSARLTAAIADMQQGSESTRLNGWGANMTPYVGVSTYQALVDICNRGTSAGASGNRLKPANYDTIKLSERIDSFTTWLWCWRAPGHSSTNTRVACRRPFAYFRRASTGVWHTIFDDRRLQGYINGTGTSNQGQFGDQRTESDGMTQSLIPPADAGLEIWCLPFHTFPTGTAAGILKDFDRYYIGAEVQLILDNPNGVDDRANARFIIQQGWDPYSQSNQSQNILGSRAEGPTMWPVHATDGNSGRHILVTSTPRIVSCSNMRPGFTTGMQPPHGNTNGTFPGDYEGTWPYSVAPYTVTPEVWSQSLPAVLQGT